MVAKDVRQRYGILQLLEDMGILGGDGRNNYQCVLLIVGWYILIFKKGIRRSKIISIQNTKIIFGKGTEQQVGKMVAYIRMYYYYVRSIRKTGR